MKPEAVLLLAASLLLAGCVSPRQPHPMLTIFAPDQTSAYRIPWPTDASGNLLTGTTILLARVDVTGHVKDIHVERSSGYRELDRAALEGVRHWTFKPETRNGIPVESYARVPIDMHD